MINMTIEIKKQKLTGSENANQEQRSRQQKWNMAMTSILITEQSNLEYRYTETPGVHYLRASNTKEF